MTETPDKPRNLKKRKILIVLLILGVYAVAAYLYQRTGGPPRVNVLTGQTFQREIASGVHVVDFWAEWCGPCQIQGPIMEKFAKSHAGKIRVGKIDVDAEGEIAAGLDIHSIPTIIIFKDGREVSRFVGVTSEAEMTREAGKYL